MGFLGTTRALVRIPVRSNFSFHLIDGGNLVGLWESSRLYGRARLVARLITAKSIWLFFKDWVAKISIWCNSVKINTGGPLCFFWVAPFGCNSAKNNTGGTLVKKIFAPAFGRCNSGGELAGGRHLCLKLFSVENFPLMSSHPSIFPSAFLRFNG